MTGASLLMRPMAPGCVAPRAAPGGLTIGFRWGGVPRLAGAATGNDGVFVPNAFVRIAPDNTVTVIVKHVEMGPGTDTGLATILAEELDADWVQVHAESAQTDGKLYNNLLFGTMRVTGSTAVANSWDQLRQVGATARAILVAAAAADWRVPASEITVERGVVKHSPSGRRATFGALAGKAAAQPIPVATDGVKPKEPNNYRLIGQRLPRLDTAGKTDGTARIRTLPIGTTQLKGI
jgi:isoquinoline 1-oxidoreductase beta subunit